MTDKSHRPAYEIALEEAMKNLPKVLVRETGEEEDFLPVPNVQKSQEETVVKNVVSLDLPEEVHEQLIKKGITSISLGNINNIFTLLEVVSNLDNKIIVSLVVDTKSDNITLVMPTKDMSDACEKNRKECFLHAKELLSLLKKDTKKAKTTKTPKSTKTKKSNKK